MKIDLEKEAERMLEEIMSRRNWTPNVRDSIADRLKEIVDKCLTPGAVLKK